MRSFKYFATTIYDHRNQSILSVVKDTEPEPYFYKHEDFHTIFGYYLTPDANSTSYNAITIETGLFNMGLTLRMYKDLFTNDDETPRGLLINLILLPIHFSTSGWHFANSSEANKNDGTPRAYLPVPDETNSTAAAASIVPRVASAPWTVYIFIVLSGTILLYSIAILAWASLKSNHNPPNTSSFSEIDFASKSIEFFRQSERLTGKDLPYALRELALGNAESAQIVEAIAKKRLRVGSAFHEATGKNAIVIVMSDDKNGLRSAWGNEESEPLRPLQGLTPGKVYI